MRQARGFTLIEILVAISVFALVSAIAFGGLARVLKSRDAVETERAFWRDFALAFKQLEDDLGHARARKARAPDGEAVSAFLGGGDDRRADAAVLELTRGGVPVFGEGVRSDLQRVAYRVQDGRLVRASWRALDHAPDSAPLESALLEGVDTLQVRFYTENGQWTEAWPVVSSASHAGTPPTASEALPRGVEIKMHIEGRGEFVRTLLVGE